MTSRMLASHWQLRKASQLDIWSIQPDDDQQLTD